MTESEELFEYNKQQMQSLTPLNLQALVVSGGWRAFEVIGSREEIFTSPNRSKRAEEERHDTCHDSFTWGATNGRWMSLAEYKITTLT